MHFFLNKSGWSAKYGWTLKPDYNRLPKYLSYNELVGIRNSILEIIGPKTKWHPNMGATTRAVQPCAPIYKLQNNPHHQTENPVG